MLDVEFDGGADLDLAFSAEGMAGDDSRAGHDHALLSAAEFLFSDFDVKH